MFGGVVNDFRYRQNFFLLAVSMLYCLADVMPDFELQGSPLRSHDRFNARVTL